MSAWDSDLPETIRVADEHARTLQDMALDAQSIPQFAALSYEAADAFDVAADAWEELGNIFRATTRRRWASDIRIDAFEATHARARQSWFVISKMEARHIARDNGMALPKAGKIVDVLVRLRSSRLPAYVSLETHKRGGIWLLNLRNLRA